MRRRSLPPLLAAPALALALTACGGGDEAAVEEDPAGALREAVDALADYDGVEMTFFIDGDRELAAEAIEAGELSDEDFDLIVNSEIIVRAAGTTQEDAEFQMVFNLGGTEVADMRAIGTDSLYVTVDMDAIASQIDDPAFEQELEGMVGAAEMFGMGDAAAALRDGEWIEVTGLEQMAAMAEQMGDAEQPSDEELAQFQQRVSETLGRFVEEDAEVTPVDDSGDGDGARVRVSASGADVQELLAEFEEIAASMSGVDAADMQGEMGEVGDVTFDAWISDGQLSQIGFDFGVLEGGEPTDEGYLYIGIAEFSGGVDVPDDTVTVDLFELMGGMMGGGMGMEMGEDPFGEDGEDPFAEDGDDPFAEDGEDPFAEDGEDPFADDGDDPTAEDGAGEPDDFCVTDEEIAELEEFGGPEAVEEIEAAIEQGLLERC